MLRTLYTNIDPLRAWLFHLMQAFITSYIEQYKAQEVYSLLQAKIVIITLMGSQANMDSKKERKYAVSQAPDMSGPQSML